MHLHPWPDEQEERDDSDKYHAHHSCRQTADKIAASQKPDTADHDSAGKDEQDDLTEWRAWHSKDPMFSGPMQKVVTSCGGILRLALFDE